MKIYTKTGDKGFTRLGSGTQVPKNDLIVEITGLFDEFTCKLGIAQSYCNVNKNVTTTPGDKYIDEIQTDIYHIMGELSGNKQYFDSERVLELEKQIDEWQGQLEPLKNFIAPGGCLASCYLHDARTFCRKVERKLVEMGSKVSGRNDTRWKTYNIRPEIFQYVNRLSDFLFVMARMENKLQGYEDRILRTERKR